MSTVDNNNANLSDVASFECTNATVTSSISAATVIGTTSVTAETATLDTPTSGYGSLRVQGANKGSYNGISLPPPTSGFEGYFMNSGTFFGIYDQTNSRWSCYTQNGSDSRFYNGSNNLFLRSGVTGQFGSCQIDGNATGGWYGLSLGGRMTLMEDGSTTMGLYNDTDNRWILRRNGVNVNMYGGNSTLQYMLLDSTDISTNSRYYQIRNYSSGQITFFISANSSLTTGSGIDEHYQTTRYYYHTNSGYYWAIGMQTQTPSSTDADLYFSVNLSGSGFTHPAYIQDNTSLTQMNFTGQHPVVYEKMSYQDLVDSEGLIVCADQNVYENVNQTPGVDSITITESLPHVSLSTSYMQPNVFGIISVVEDTNTTKRSGGAGIFRTKVEKIPGDFRVYANSVGEGAMWVIDSHGTLSAGDYITSSNVPGYGCKQNDDLLHNYTVAKITMDCNFNPQMVYQKKMRMKKVFKEVNVKTTKIQETERSEVVYNEETSRYERTVYQDQTEIEEDVIDEVDLYDAETDEIIGKHKVTRTELQEIEEPDRDPVSGRIIWDDSSEQELEYSLRYVNSQGQTITDLQYNSGTPGVDVFKACFVGVTYHCG